MAKRHIQPYTYRDGLLAFVDDSGNNQASEWYVLAGYISTPEGWFHFQEKWQAVLDHRPKLEAFKGNRVFAKRRGDPWASMTDDERDARLRAFIRVIGECTMRAYYVAIRSIDFNEILHDQLYSELRSPYYWLFITCLKCMESVERHAGDGRRISCVFDYDEVHPHNAIQFLKDQYRTMGLAGRLGNVGYADDSDTLQLQGADLIAWQVRHALSNPGRESPYFQQCLSAPLGKPSSHVLTREDLISHRDGMIINAKKNGLRIEERRVGGTDRKPIMRFVAVRDPSA